MARPATGLAPYGVLVAVGLLAVFFYSYAGMDMRVSWSCYYQEVCWDGGDRRGGVAEALGKARSHGRPGHSGAGLAFGRPSSGY